MIFWKRADPLPMFLTTELLACCILRSAERGASSPSAPPVEMCPLPQVTQTGLWITASTLELRINHTMKSARAQTTTHEVKSSIPVLCSTLLGVFLVVCDAFSCVCWIWFTFYINLGQAAKPKAQRKQKHRSYSTPTVPEEGKLRKTHASKKAQKESEWTKE